MFNINFTDDWIRTANLYYASDRSTNWATTTALRKQSYVIIWTTSLPT